MTQEEKIKDLRKANKMLHDYIDELRKVLRHWQIAFCLMFAAWLYMLIAYVLK